MPKSGAQKICERRKRETDQLIGLARLLIESELAREVDLEM